MPINEIPEFFHAEIRYLIDFALEDAWQEESATKKRASVLRQA